MPTPFQLKRTYLFADGTEIEFESVKKVKIQDNGKHVITLMSGKRVIVNNDYRTCTIEGERPSSTHGRSPQRVR